MVHEMPASCGQEGIKIYLWIMLYCFLYESRPHIIERTYPPLTCDSTEYDSRDYIRTPEVNSAAPAIGPQKQVSPVQSFDSLLRDLFVVIPMHASD
jgi:hypothetical protein